MAGLDGSRIVCGDWKVDRMAQVHLSLCISATHYITHPASSLIVSSTFNINFMLPIVLDAVCRLLALYLDLACLYHIAAAPVMFMAYSIMFCAVNNLSVVLNALNASWCL